MVTVAAGIHHRRATIATGIGNGNVIETETVTANGSAIGTVTGTVIETGVIVRTRTSEGTHLLAQEVILVVVVVVVVTGMACPLPPATILPAKVPIGIRWEVEVILLHHVPPPVLRPLLSCYLPAALFLVLPVVLCHPQTIWTIGGQNTIDGHHQRQTINLTNTHSH
uniref:Uncharacterized protein n=1 Tax=Anopheles maculatus TaxID=74869 RepID=A0A182SX57_9DIPT